MVIAKCSISKKLRAMTKLKCGGNNMDFKNSILGLLRQMKKPKVLLIFTIILLTIVCLVTMFYVWNSSIQSTAERALKLATTAEAGFQADEVSKLDVNANDISKPEYQQIKNGLNKLVEINKEIRFAYIYTLINDKFYFMVDSEYPNTKDYSPPGQEYPEATNMDKAPYKEGRIVVTDPAPDRWGTWISVLVPMKDPNTGNTIAVFGVDYPEQMWDNYAVGRTEYVFLIYLFLILLTFAYYGIFSKNIAIRYEKNKLAYANDLLKEQEELFRTMFEQSPIGIAFGNEFGSMSNINPAFEKITGRTKSELATMRWQDITHPDDLELDAYNFERLKSGAVDGYSLNKRYTRPDGSYVWVNITIVRLELDKNIDFSHLCMVEDITDRIQAEQELRESERSKAVLLSNLPGMAYRCNYDREWTMQFVSEGCYELTGYKPESLLQNKDITFNDLISPDYREKLWNIWGVILKNKIVFREEYEMFTASGEVKWVFEQGRGVYDEKGQIEAIEGLIIDITDQKKREDEIRYLNYHDVLTSLYNRRFFEEEKIRLDQEIYMPLSVIIGDINGLKLINDSLGHAEGDKLIVAMANILNNCCRKSDILSRTGGDEFSILMPNTSNEEAYKIIKSIGLACEEYKRKTKNDPYHTSISLGCATKTDVHENLNGVINTAEEYMYRYKLLQNKSLHSSVISSMKTALYEKSQETEEHAQRLINLSIDIGKKMNITNEQLNELELLCTLHDIGKIGISDNIINKPSSLTEEEQQQMRKHPEIGYRIAMTSPELLPIAEYILCHHERWDGTGYPQGLKGEEIPLLSRILMVVDAYDAMITDRSYRKAMSQEAAIAEIGANVGTQFDPEIAKIFFNILKTNE